MTPLDPFDEFGNPADLREFEVGGKLRWRWISTRDDFQTRFDHQVWLTGPDNTVMWEVWHGSHCLGVQDTRKKGVEEARKLIARVRKNGQDTKFANRAYASFQEFQTTLADIPEEDQS